MKKVVVFLAEGFEECEALLVVDLLRRAGIDVIMASVSDKKEVVSSRYITVLADALAKDVDYEQADMIVLPGGVKGTANLAACGLVKEQCKAFAEKKLLAAICAAPSIFASLGLLEGRQATCHPSYEEKMHKAVITKESVTVDGNITTGQGLGAAMPFAFELITQLAGSKEAQRVADAICYRS